MAYRISVFILGVVIAAYWARVVQMARKARRRTGRAANLLPAEPLGRVLRIIWMPVVVIWIAQPFVTGAGSSHMIAFRPVWGSAWIAGPAAGIAALCLVLSRTCWKAMGKNWRMGIDPSERTALVISGPYRYVRHPIYALSQAMMFATAAAVPSPLMLAAAAAHVLLLQWEARREEHYLLRIHGQEYQDFCRQVPRFVPRSFTNPDSPERRSSRRGSGRIASVE